VFGGELIDSGALDEPVERGDHGGAFAGGLVGGAVQRELAKVMGHEDIATTMQLYVRRTEDREPRGGRDEWLDTDEENRFMADRQQYSEDDPRHHTVKLKGMLDQARQHAREDVDRVNDPKA